VRAINHPRKDKIRSFNRGKIRIKVGDNSYSADVVTGILASGRELFYDIVTLKPETIIEATPETATQSLRQSQNGVTSDDTTIPQGTDGVNTSISKTDGNDTQYSVADDVDAEIRRLITVYFYIQ
jgi:hypothetical protein